METKKGYKLQEFVAHAGNVNCLSFGKKNCRVFITGGDDQKVNLWSVGKPTSLMSLCGHTSPVESASFDSSEVLVIAGSSSGAIKLWDLEETKLVRTLTGHRSYCTAVEFHPFGEFFASGSMDTNLKIWDIRKKGCIHTYKGHTRGISTIRFSPDGRWVVSGGFDNVVKVWDLTAGKLLHDFKFHEGHVRAIEFHPLEFLLATGSADKTVKFWDLETFEMIGSGRRESSGVRSITFHPDGRSLFCGFDDSLKVYSWEPVICHDSVDMGWSTLGDLCVHDGKLLGGAYYENSVAIWVADISLMDRNGSRLATEQLGQREQKSANQGSLLEKEESQEKSKPNPRPATPESDSKDIKTIYVDTAGVNSSTSKTVDPVDAPKVVLRRSNSITSKTIDPLDAPKVAHSSDSKVMSTAGTQKRAPTVKNVSSSNRSLVMPSIVPRDGPTGRDTAGSRRNSLAPATRTSVAMSAKSQARRLSDNRFDMGRLSVSLESVPSENLKSSVARTKDANFHSRVVADENTKESSREKQSSIKTVVEKTDRTPLPATASSTEGDQSLSSSKEAKPVRVVNGVSVVHGRTRSLVERFERRETPDVTETETLVGASDAAAESTVSRVIGEPVVSHVIAEPVESHVNAEPVASRTTASPATSRVSADPVGSRMTTSPVTSRVSAEPVSSRMTTSPATSRATADPPASRATAVPVASRSTAVPVASRATAVPVASRRTVEPLPFRLTDEPVVSRTTAQPVRSCLTAQPMQITSSKKGDQQVMNEEPPSGDNNVIEILMQNHDMLLSTYKSRLTKLQVVRHFWERNDVKGTINAVKKLPDRSVQADVAGVLIDRVEIITLDLFSCLLPVLIGLLESTAERHATVSLEMLLKLVAVFGTVVRSTVSAPPAVGVDLHLEERRACCRQCFAHLQNVQKFLPELVKRGGVVARCAQQLNMVLQQVLL